MELTVLDLNFNDIGIIDIFESLIWTDRYSKYGDFEIYLSVNQIVSKKNLMDVCKFDYYIRNRDSDRLMIVEEIKKDSSTEVGRHLTITGRSLESILLRRVVPLTVITGNVQVCIKQLIISNIISPMYSGRTIPNFIFKDSTDTAITQLPSLNAQYEGETLYDIIVALCDCYGLGFKITLNDANQFVFELFSGIDRSYDQVLNPYVVFSPNYENISSSNYVISRDKYKNKTWIVDGDGTGMWVDPPIINGTPIIEGLDVREAFTNAKDMKQGESYPSEYTGRLAQRGFEDLLNYKQIQAFDGDVEATITFKYGTDFFLGDIVQIEDEEGLASKARVDEMIRSQNKEGYTSYPTFTIIEDEEN